MAALANTVTLSVLRNASKTLQTGARGCSARSGESFASRCCLGCMRTARRAPNRGRHPDLMFENDPSTSSQMEDTTWMKEDLNRNWCWRWIVNIQNTYCLIFYKYRITLDGECGWVGTSSSLQSSVCKLVYQNLVNCNRYIYIFWVLSSYSLCTEKVMHMSILFYLYSK